MALNWRRDYTRYQKYFLNIIALYNRRPDLKMFLEIFLSLGTIALFGVFALKPTFVTIIQLLSDIKAKEEMVAQMDTKIKNLGIAQNLLTQQSAKIAVLETAIPADPRPASFVRQVEGLAQKNGVTIVGISTGETVLKGTVKAVKKDEELDKLPENVQNFTTAINLSGTYGSLANFLADIENLRRPLWIDALNFNIVKTDQGQSLVLSLTGRVPFTNK